VVHWVNQFSARFAQRNHLFLLTSAFSGPLAEPIFARRADNLTVHFHSGEFSGVGRDNGPTNYASFARRRNPLFPRPALLLDMKI
jgi:hypothetical protein